MNASESRVTESVICVVDDIHCTCSERFEVRIYSFIVDDTFRSHILA